LTVKEALSILFMALREGKMFRPRAVVAVAVSYTMFLMPVSGATPAAIGTVTSATSAHVGAVSASTGTTVFGGDRLSTEQAGSVQVRAGDARFMLSGSSLASLGEANGIPVATLLRGTAIFSTANAKAFVLHASTAEIRPKDDQPTVGQVTYINDKEFLVRSTRGSLAITVDGETQFVPEATAYHAYLKPDEYLSAHPEAAAAQGPRGVGSRSGGPPLKAGRSHFLLIAIIVTSVATGVVLYEALQSPDRP
jgi:hypothetical protein